MNYTINKKVAPNNYKDFCRWFKTACNLPVSADEAWESLGRKVPKNENRRVKEKE